MSRRLELMPAGAVRRQAVGEALWFWSRALLLASLLCGAFGAAEAWRCQTSCQQREALEAQHEPVKQLRNDIVKLKAQIESLTNEENLALELASNRSMVTLMGQLGRAAAYAEGDLYLASLSFERQPALTGEPPRMVLHLEGAAGDQLAVTRFAEGLRGAEMFAEVQLKSTATKQLASQAATAFDIECVF